MPSAANRRVSTPLTFTFKNIGPIKDAELELGDLTIIAGRNNTGKTYLTYTLYGFLKTWDTWPGSIAWPFGGHESSPPTIFEQIFKQVEEQGHAAVSVDRDALGHERQEILRRSTASFSKGSLADTFNAPADTFKGASIGVDLDPAFPESPRAVDLRIRVNETLSIRLNGTDIVVTASTPGKPSLTDLRLAPYVSRLYLRFLFPELPFDPFVLSAERLGISLFYRELDFSKSQLVDLLQKFGGREEDEDRSLPFFLVDRTFSRYARPIKDNIDYTRSIPDLRKQRSEVYGDRLFSDIRSLMGGEYAASRDEIVFRSAARGPRRFSIPLHLASSSVRGLSDLYFFLRHVWEPRAREQVRRSLPLLEYLRSVCEVEREAPFDGSRIHAGYLVICENRRLYKQTLRAEPAKTAGSEEYKDITVRTYIGTTISPAILAGVSPD